MGIKNPCKVKGCLTFGYHGYLQQHERLPHTACSCGWAGRSWGGHISRNKQRHPDTFKDENHELVHMKWSDKEQTWLRISKWEALSG